MRVRRVDILQAEAPVDGPRSASARWHSRSGLLLRLEDADGRVGLGEASPLPGYSPDLLSETRAALHSVNWAAIPHADAGESARAWLQRLPAAPFAGTAPGSPSARFALETALLDLLGQRRGEPVHRLLSDDVTPVPLCVLAGGADDEDVVQAAARAASEGAHTVKLKITGPSLQEQMRTLEAVRAVLGETALRLDANRTFTETANQELRRLLPLAPELVEEPAPLDVLLRAGTPPVPTALDETLQDAGAWERAAPALARLGCAALVLKPTALGGFAACMGWGARAAEHGLDATISHAFEGPVALAASLHLALAVGSRSRASGLAPHGGLRAWALVRQPMLGRTSVESCDLPGLGIPASLFD